MEYLDFGRIIKDRSKLITHQASECHCIYHEVSLSCGDLHEAGEALVGSLLVAFQVHSYLTHLTQMLGHNFKLLRCLNKHEGRLFELLVLLWLHLSLHLHILNLPVKFFDLVPIRVRKADAVALASVVLHLELLGQQWIQSLELLSSSDLLGHRHASMGFALQRCHKHIVRVVNLLPPGMLWLFHGPIAPWELAYVWLRHNWLGCPGCLTLLSVNNLVCVFD